VKADCRDVLATAYVKQCKNVIYIASWNRAKVGVTLKFDWNTLCLDPEKAEIRAPETKGFQQEAQFRVTERIPVLPGRGWLLIMTGW
jgi:hypothetical protein